MRIRTARDAASIVRGRRTDLKLSQSRLAERAKVSRKWIYEFEAGKATAEFGIVIRVLEQLGLELRLVPTASRGIPRGAVDLDAVLAGVKDVRAR